MPRKPRITAVPVDEEVTHAEGDASDVKTTAEQMTDVTNEVNIAQPALQPDPIAPKAKAKRTASKKLVVAAPLSEPEVTIEASLEDVEATVTLPKEVAKEDLKIACPDCGKKMSAKTLKYSHGPNCAAKKPKDQEASNNADSVVEHGDENQRIHNVRLERAARREDMVNELMKNAF